ncbi:MAG: dephospho-CoA kinase [Desulfovibrio sp.]|nr:dephospho-CoA kinase [Desulfovibrio sp.]
MNDFFAVVGHENRKKRLDQFLSGALRTLSRSALQRFIRDGLCRINDVAVLQPDHRLREGDQIVLTFEESSGELTPEEGPVDILWHDETLCVINKAPGITVHPCPSCPRETLIQRLLPIFPSLSSMEGLRPGIVHRIDKDTSGLLLVALDEKTRLALSELFAARRVHKTYLALVRGVPEENGHVDVPVGRHPAIKTKMAPVSEEKGGREAHTAWKRLWKNDTDSISLLSVSIATGRTHQIRVHMASLGFPLLGDRVYADAETSAMAPRQMLHAWDIAFEHPGNHTHKHFRVPPPDDFMRTLLLHATPMLRIVITGNPASGKSSVLNALKRKGIPVFSADKSVHGLYSAHGQLSQWLACHGGAEILTDSGEIDREKLFVALKENRIFKRDLEFWLHACVRDMLETFWKNHAGNSYTAAEIPLWHECGWKATNTLTVFVDCPQAQRFARLKELRGWSHEKISTIESWQWPEEKKKTASTLIIDNSGTAHDLEKNINEFYEKVCAIQKEKEKEITKNILNICGHS